MDRTRAEAMRARATWRIGRAVAVAFLAVAAVPVAVTVPGLPDVARPVIGILSLFVGVPAAILLFRDAAVLRRLLSRDVRSGQVVVFGEGERESLVLPNSRVVISHRGVAPSGIRQATIGEAAVGPAVLAAFRPLAATDEWVERPLTADERDEIRRRAARLGRLSPFLLVWTGMAVVGVGLWLKQHPHRVPPWLAVILAIGIWWWVTLVGRSRRRRLEADAARGVAFLATAGQHVRKEVLPTSGVLWTDAGAPAPWRQETK